MCQSYLSVQPNAITNHGDPLNFGEASVVDNAAEGLNVELLPRDQHHKVGEVRRARGLLVELTLLLKAGRRKRRHGGASGAVTRGLKLGLVEPAIA